MESMTTVSLFSAALPKWLLRVLSYPYGSGLDQDPLLFAQWFSMMDAIIDWELIEGAQEVITRERNKKLSMERMTSLADRLGFHKGSSEKTRLLLQGYELHDWLTEDRTRWDALIQQVPIKLDFLDKIDDQVTKLSPSNQRLVHMSEALELSTLQKQLLEFAVVGTIDNDFADFFGALTVRYQRSLSLFWSHIFDATHSEMMGALDPEGTLLRSGLMLAPLYARAQPGSFVKGNRHYLHRVEDWWIGFLFDDPERSLREMILEPYEPRNTAGVMAVLSDEDEQLVVQVLTRQVEHPEDGVHLLLYGAANLDKKRMLRSIEQKTQKAVHALPDSPSWAMFQLRPFQEAHTRREPLTDEVRRSLVFLALALCEGPAMSHTHAVLVSDHAPEVLGSSRQGEMAFLRMFGVDAKDEGDEDLREDPILTKYRTPVLWMMGDSQKLAPQALAQFMVHVSVKKADRKQRQAQILEVLGENALGENIQEEIAKLESVSATQIQSALRLSNMLQHEVGKERDQSVLSAVRRSQKAMGRDLTERFKASDTQYSMEYLNCAGRFGPQQILKALEKNRRGTLAFYGLPGTGKTQFVEHMALTLGMPLMTKRASDLMSKWVGENEKNIANMFEEAINEDALLLLDEGDSFLRDRSYARSSWEVTMVNELLQHMERFPGIFVVCTNLFEGLDSAALRRFSFKLEFGPLSADQRWEMFLNETGLRGSDTLAALSESERLEWWERLALMSKLTAGDFATIQRQSRILDVQLSPEDWFVQLEQEVRLKRNSDTTGRPMAGMD